MRQFVHCNGCNSQVFTPESLDAKPGPQFLHCQSCGTAFFWNGGLTDNSQPLILFSIEDPASEDINPSDDIEIAMETPSAISSVPLNLAPPESVAVPTEAAASNYQTPVTESVPSESVPSESVPSEPVHSEPVHSEPVHSEPLTPQEALQHVELAPPQGFESESNANDIAPMPFALELEIDPEPAPSLSDSETPDSPATDLASGHGQEPVLLDEPVHETDMRGEAFPFEKSPLVERAAPDQTAPAVDWSVLGPAVPRQRPKEASALRKILPPVLGGLAAFPIATLILWYGFGKDIGTTGPTVAKYIPWIVPEKFRGMPFESASPNFASGRPQRSGPSTRNTLPTLNREETVVPPNNRSSASPPTKAVEKPIVAPEKPATLAEPTKNSVSETAVSKIPETLDALKSLQKDMASAADDRAKMTILVAFDTKLKELSKQAFALTGPSARMWNQQLESISRKILADAVIPRALKKIANRAREEIPASTSGDFVATVLEVGDGNEPSPNEKWVLHEKWPADQAEIPIEVLPGAWRPGSSSLPTTCLVFGRLLPLDNSDPSASESRSTGTGLVLRVHLLVPK